MPRAGQGASPDLRRNGGRRRHRRGAGMAGQRGRGARDDKGQVRQAHKRTGAKKGVYNRAAPPCRIMHHFEKRGVVVQQQSSSKKPFSRVSFRFISFSYSRVSLLFSLLLLLCSALLCSSASTSASTSFLNFFSRQAPNHLILKNLINPPSFGFFSSRDFLFIYLFIYPSFSQGPLYHTLTLPCLALPEPPHHTSPRLPTLPTLPCLT